MTASKVADDIVIGESLAGFSAALLLAESGRRVVLIPDHRDTDALADFPRIRASSLHPSATGAAFVEEMNERLARLGVERPTNCHVDQIDVERNGNTVVVCAEQRWSCQGVVFAPNGTEPGVATTIPFHGRGVSYSAATDAPLIGKRPMAVYGDAPRAIEHAWIAMRFASEVVVLLKDPIAGIDPVLLRELQSSPSVAFAEQVDLLALHPTSDGMLGAIDIRTLAGVQRIDVAALFIAQHLAVIPPPGNLAPEAVVFAGLAAGVAYWDHAQLVNDGARAALRLRSLRSS